MYLLSVLLATSALFYGHTSGYSVQPFKVDLAARVSHMNELIERTQLPNYSVLGDAGAGIKLSWLQERQKQWVGAFNWTDEQNYINGFNHSTVEISNLTVHFIHQRSNNPNAIPLLLTHGWPGSFYEFNQVVRPLSNPANQSDAAFHVVVPSLPGFGFSSPPPVGWTLNNTASLFDTLLVEVLGYKSYLAVGGDWVGFRPGCVVTWGLHNNPGHHAKAILYTGLIPQLGPSLEHLLSDPRFVNQTQALNADETRRLRDNSNFTTDENGYFIEQATRPATIGLALYDNPIGQLAWMGEKYVFGDPLIGTSPSTLNNETILTAVSIYYLTQTFETAVNTYYQNPNEFTPYMRHSVSRIPMGFASYRYELAYYPEFYIKEVGNLVYYAEHARGGHFSALDNPPAYIADIRAMSHWYQE